MFISLRITLILVCACYAKETVKNTNEIENTNLKISISESKALEKFRPLVGRSLVPDEEKTDAFLLRWLRVSDLSVPEAMRKLQEAQNWRRENHIDTILNETILELNPEPYDVNGFDKLGHPVLVAALGALDIRKYAVQGKGNLAFRYVIQLIEKVLARRKIASQMFGKNITHAVIIIDYNGFSLRQHACISCLSVIQDVVIAIENYYPETIAQLVVINVPRIAVPVMEILKPLAPRTRKNMKFFPADRTEWTNYLSTIISLDQLPYRFGGTRKV